MMLAPLAASLMHMALSRRREFIADDEGAKTGVARQAHANALYKIGDGVGHQMPFQTAEKSRQTAQMMGMRPLFNGKLKRLLPTHPANEERIRR